ncbi:hypothetical protein DSM02_3809 [Leeuwenhoekiella polynyae]|uniref:Uncharacterized protein n=1 Tax=Leeuwenhoekiella polynyae TaxID=1550906 RepID=A0A4Q0NS44_9FLAO|nr:hypothetical protein DSM02_3809 [Leeuwenhoekiella polynyae]
MIVVIKNRDSDSGVKAYQIGTDYILVKLEIDVLNMLMINFKALKNK